MRRLILISMIALVPLTGCYKDNVEVSAMTNNPFDAEYIGQSVFVLDGTYLQTVNIGGSTVVFQVIEYQVDESLFLSPATYSVQMTDTEAGVTELMNPDPAGSNSFKYFRQPAPGQAICLELRLSNNRSTAGASTLCATL